MNGQTSTTAADVQLSDVDRLQLHNLLLQQQALRSQLELLTIQFLRTPEPRGLQDRIDQLATSIHATGERLFAAHGIDPKTYQLNVERGVFIARPD